MALLDESEQITALTVLEYLSDLFTLAGKAVFSREEVLVILDCIKNDPELFDAHVLERWAEASAEVDAD